MRKNLYFIDRYIRCGAMPIYLVFVRNMQGAKSHLVMLAGMKKLRLLLRQHKGFSDPSLYGKIIYKGNESELGESIKYMLKARYDFDFDQLNGTESRLG